MDYAVSSPPQQSTRILHSGIRLLRRRARPATLHGRYRQETKVRLRRDQAGSRDGLCTADIPSANRAGSQQTAFRGSSEKFRSPDVAREFPPVKENRMSRTRAKARDYMQPARYLKLVVAGFS